MSEPLDDQTINQPPLNNKIQKIVESVDSILIIGAEIEIHKNHQNITLASVEKVETFQVEGLYDLVLFNNILSNVSHEKAEQLIAQVRDQHSKQLLVLQSETSNWETTNFIQMGMQQIAKFNPANDTPEIWYFSLETYKRVPEWLNSRFWANPEKFDKYRW